MSEATIFGRAITEQDWQAGHVDQRCRSCGATSAGSSWCYRCSSQDVEYALHSDQMTMPGPFWCGRGAKRRQTAASTHAGAAEGPEAVSEDPSRMAA
jgi:hypothetical protein